MNVCPQVEDASAENCLCSHLAVQTTFCFHPGVGLACQVWVGAGAAGGVGLREEGRQSQGVASHSWGWLVAVLGEGGTRGNHRLGKYEKDLAIQGHPEVLDMFGQAGGLDRAFGQAGVLDRVLGQAGGLDREFGQAGQLDSFGQAEVLDMEFDQPGLLDRALILKGQGLDQLVGTGWVEEH